MPVKSKIKHLNSLKIKKYRDIHKHYIIEGEKIINELIEYYPDLIKVLLATGEWLENNSGGSISKVKEITTLPAKDIKKISSFKTSGEVMVVLDIPDYQINKAEILKDLSLVLDEVQDPGNLGNIIRIADWFGIKNIFCSPDCVDCYNPKVVQATMGSIIRIKVHYLNLSDLLMEYSSIPGFNIYGTFIKGRSVYEEVLEENAFILLGNESKGISDEYLPYIKSRLTIPGHDSQGTGIESLNVSAAAAIICSEFRRNK